VNSVSKMNFFVNVFTSLGLVLCFIFMPFSATAAVLDWDVESWPTGSLSETFTVGGSDININFASNTAQLNSAGTGGAPASPETNQFLTGGLTPTEDALFIRTDFVTTAQDVVITFDFLHPGGVSDLSFTFWDVDADIPSWVDELQVTAIANGVTVNPSNVSDGVSNSPIGANGSIGDPVDDNNSVNTSPNGNATFTFNQTGISQIIIVYSNATGGTPGNQWISLHDISFDIAPTVTKQFVPDSITIGSTSTLTITLDNNDTSAATLTSNLVDNLPTGVAVASPANIGSTCPGTVNASIGGGTVTYTSGSTIPVGGCTISVDVTSSTAGTITNTITAGALQTDLGNNAAEASDNLTVNPPIAPTMTKSFSPSVITSAGVSTLSINIGNTNTIDATLTSDVVDNLPSGIIVASPANVGGTCTGTVNAIAGGDTITYVTGSTIPAGGCNITVEVTGSTLGDFVNTIPANALQTDQGNNAAAATDTLSIANVTVPTVTKAFSPTSINAGGTSQLTLTLDNPNASVITLTSNLDDNLPTGVIATAVNAASNCPGAVDISTNTLVRYPVGATIPVAGCSIVVDVTSSSLGVFDNTILIGDLQTDVGSNASATNASLTVTSGGAGGAPVCPAGTNLVDLAIPRNADTATTTGNVSGTASNATGPVVPIGTNVANNIFPRLNPPPESLTLGFADIVPLNSNILISLAQDNDEGIVDIQDSTDNASFSAAISFSGTEPIDDLVEHLNYSVATAAGAQFLRFTVTSGGFRVTGIEYTQICEPIPQADLSITKDDGVTAYTPGGTSTYVLTVVNNGPGNVTDAIIQDGLPNGVTLAAPWTCASTAGSSCSAASGGSVGASLVSLTVDILNGGTITVNVPVRFSSDMGDF